MKGGKIGLPVGVWTPQERRRGLVKNVSNTVPIFEHFVDFWDTLLFERIRV